MAKLYERVCAAEAWIAAAFLLAMVLLIFLGGVLRMLGHPINWSGDIATCLFAWACFLCADIAWRRTEPWRGALAGLWPAIGEIRRLHVDGPLAEATLLVGWLRGGN